MSVLYVALSIADEGATGSLYGGARVVVVTSEHGAVSDQEQREERCAWWIWNVVMVVIIMPLKLYFVNKQWNLEKEEVFIDVETEWTIE